MTKPNHAASANEAHLDTYKNTITNYMYLGLLPFFMGAFGPWVLIDHEPFFIHAFLAYSSIIFSFLAGTLWTLALFIAPQGTIAQEPIPVSRYVHGAIVFSLIPFVAYFLPSLSATVLMLLGFLCLLLWEKKAVNRFYVTWYQTLRHKITFIVIACHMLTLLNIIRA